MTIPGPLLSFPKMKKSIALVVIEILAYRQETITLYIKGCFHDNLNTFLCYLLTVSHEHHIYFLGSLKVKMSSRDLSLKSTIE